MAPPIYQTWIKPIYASHHLRCAELSWPQFAERQYARSAAGKAVGVSQSPRVASVPDAFALRCCALRLLAGSRFSWRAGRLAASDGSQSPAYRTAFTQVLVSALRGSCDQGSACRLEWRPSEVLARRVSCAKYWNPIRRPTSPRAAGARGKQSRECSSKPGPSTPPYPGLCLSFRAVFGVIWGNSTANPRHFTPMVRSSAHSGLDVLSTCQ